MESAALVLFQRATAVALSVALPFVGAVALVGVAIGVIQTIVQVQDQNVSFAPKLLAVAAIALFGGPAMLAALRALLLEAVAAMPHIMRG